MFDIRWYLAKKKSTPLIRFLRLLMIFVVLFLPLALIMVIFAPLAPKQESRQYERPKYSLSKGFEQDEVIKVIAIMRTDAEFYFQFNLLDKNTIANIALEIYEILQANKEKGQLLTEIEKRKREVSSMALLFEQLNFPEDFTQRMKDYQNFNDITWQFLHEEFKLSILAVCYRSVYEPNFTLVWDTPSKLAAQKFRNIMSDVKALNSN